MQKLPRLSGKDVIKVLSKAGFLAVRQKGSHVIAEDINILKKVEMVLLSSTFLVC